MHGGPAVKLIVMTARLRHHGDQGRRCAYAAWQDGMEDRKVRLDAACATT
jgi:hypothetical protein